jgi:NADH dehydrogenase [ubiquinone] 1 alpha subcomplex assembly factor 7
LADFAPALMERLDHFMARANAAYYASRDPFRDFTTSPEISQVFGEILGLWAAVSWELIGRPDPVLLVELGPGRGTLMADALRAITAVAPAFRAALRLHLVEVSPRLRAIQAEQLAGATWHDKLDSVPELPVLLLGNEFLDALPIRQFVRRGATWMECYVAEGRLIEVLATDPPTSLPQGQAGEAIVEFNQAAADVACALARRFLEHPGAALFLDYGPEQSAAGDSLQALRGGKPANPLDAPGSADLTAHVDFAALAAAARGAGAMVWGPVPQGLFLARLGLFQRTDRLARGQPPARAAGLIEAARRLAEPHRMGRLFKALALTSPGLGSLPGFVPPHGCE